MSWFSKLFSVREGATHDYTQRGWGHDYTFSPGNGGRTGSMTGWGHGIERGDYLLLHNGGGSTRYRVAKIEYYSDPSDMWNAEVVFAPRTATT